MIEFERVFIDTSPYIYLLERNETYAGKVEQFFTYCIENQKQIVTSAVTVEEFSVGPYRNNDEVLVDDFKAFLMDTDTAMMSIDDRIADDGARIRAKFAGFKGMDALQLACAKSAKCDLFLTNDKQLRQYVDVKVITVEELDL